MAIQADSYAAPELVREPGGFARHPKTGAPYVAHPTETTKHSGRKDELLALCAERGIAVPPAVTVAQLHALLGERPKRVQYGRPSSLGKQIENMTNIQKWSERAVALGMFLRPELLDPLRELDPTQLNLDDEAARDVLDAIAVQGKSVAQAGLAADRGTHHHELTEDHDLERDWIERATRGEDLGVPVEVQHALVEAWRKMLATHGIEILAVEATCVDDVWRQAGTLDRICRLTRELRFRTVHGEIVTLPAGWVGILDIKTGKLRLDRAGLVSYWQGYAVQLASYAQSVPYDCDADTRGEWGFDIDQTWAIIAHLDVLAALDGTAVCRLFLVDLAAGREAGERCVWARSWEKRTDVFSVPDADLAVEVPVAAPSLATEVEQPAGEEGSPAQDPSSPATPTDPMAFAMLAEAIKGWDDRVRQRLAVHWPIGVPSPGAVRRGEAVWTDEHLDAMRVAFDEAGAPFNLVTEPAPEVEQPAVELSPPVEAEPTVADDEIDTFVEAITSEGVRAQLNAWLAEGREAGHVWQPRVTHLARHLEIARAAHHLAVLFADDDDCDDYVRAVLAAALQTDAAEHPAVPVGVALAHLTIDEARLVQSICAAVASDDAHLSFSDDGRPVVVVDVAALAA